MKSIKKLKQKLARTKILKKRYYCSACQNSVNFFTSAGVKSPMFEELKISGGGYRRSVTCPICGANDRIRWTDLVLERFTNIYTEPCYVLHIAPETIIEKKLRYNKKCNYLSGDMERGKADEVVDVTKMQYTDKKFDYIIMNHVLEHVPNEGKAIQEITRCLKDKGQFIVSFPICLDRDTFEDSNIKSEEDRLKYYGQKDHCRLYGKDAKKRLESYNLTVEEYNTSDILSEEDIKKYNVLENNIVYICQKN